MIIKRRFSLTEDRHVIDTLDPANTGKVYIHEGEPEDERHLRECVLWRRLSDLVDKLIIKLNPNKTLPSDEECQPRNEQRYAISRAIFYAIKSSHLNSFDPIMPVRHRFGGTSKRTTKGTRDFTSLSLFCEDVECLLRDLFGDIESEALDDVLRAVLSIVEEFTKYVRPDLWREHSDAMALDYMLGIGVPDGYGISGSDWRQGMAAIFDLIVRACNVGANPSAFSDYTVGFAKRFGEHWKLPSNQTEFLGLSDEMKMRWFLGPEESTCEIQF
jgi:hypothetical protein